VHHKLEDALWDADAAFKRLKFEQGAIARRNAREAMMKALRKARKALDDEYPLQRRVAKKKRKRSKDDGRVRVSTIILADLLRAGVNRSHFRRRPSAWSVDFEAKERAKALKKGRGREDKEPPVQDWAPGWMVRALTTGFDAKAVSKAVSDRKLRHKIATVVALGGKVSK